MSACVSVALKEGVACPIQKHTQTYTHTHLPTHSHPPMGRAFMSSATPSLSVFLVDVSLTERSLSPTCKPGRESARPHVCVCVGVCVCV